MTETSYILLCDETNKEPSEKGRFFIYGGLFVPISAIKPLNDTVEEIRLKYGYRPGDLFKFSPKTKPEQVPAESFRQAKQDVLDRCSQLGLTSVFSLTHHEIAKHRSIDELIGWGANTVFGAFNEYLSGRKATGLAITDRLPFVKEYDFLRSKFQIGLSFPSGKTRRLSNILLFASSCEGASNLLSVNDIILGAFRYCINELDKTIAPREIMRRLIKLIWRFERDGKIYLNEFGLRFRPKELALDSYRKEYQEIEQHLKNLIEET